MEGKSMKRELPEDIKEAVDLLKKSEKWTNNILRINAFEDAIDILNDHISVETAYPHKAFIENIKISYTRKFLEGLSDLVSMEKDWSALHYLHLFTGKVPKEVKVIIEKDAQLRINYEKFKSFCIKEFKLLKQDILR
jgi:hypothetical protein